MIFRTFKRNDTKPISPAKEDSKADGSSFHWVKQVRTATVFSLRFYASSGENLSLADLILESAGFLFCAPSFRLSSYDCAPGLVFAPFLVCLQGDVPHLTSTFPSPFRSVFVSVAARLPSSCSHGFVFWQSNAVLLACDRSPRTCRDSHTD